jgi:hypothetical protein
MRKNLLPFPHSVVYIFGANGTSIYEDNSKCFPVIDWIKHDIY